MPAWACFGVVGGVGVGVVVGVGVGVVICQAAWRKAACGKYLYYLGIGPRTSTPALATVDFCACGKAKQSNSLGEVKDSNWLYTITN